MFARSRAISYARHGYDHGSAVSTRYEAPFAYTGDLEQVVIEAGKKPSDTADVEARTEMGRQ